jgi:hypothetical protein
MSPTVAALYAKHCMSPASRGTPGSTKGSKKRSTVTDNQRRNLVEEYGMTNAEIDALGPMTYDEYSVFLKDLRKKGEDREAICIANGDEPDKLGVLPSE